METKELGHILENEESEEMMWAVEMHRDIHAKNTTGDWRHNERPQWVKEWMEKHNLTETACLDAGKNFVIRTYYLKISQLLENKNNFNW